jgi:hypothetical protein
MPVADEAADMFNVMRDTRSRSVGGRRTGGSFGRESFGGFGDRRSSGFGDFGSNGGSFDRCGGFRDSGLRYRGGSGGFRRPSNEFGRSSFSRSDRFGDLDKGISAGVADLTLAVPGALMIQAPHVMGDNPLALTLQISAASRIPSDEWNSGFLAQF